MSAVTVLAVGSGLAFLVYGGLCLFSASMEDEFTRFGLARFRVLTGLLEVLAGLGLLVGLRWPPALWVSAGGLAVLMFCGVVVRLRVNDSLVDMLPALSLMIANGYLLWLSSAGM